MNDLTSTSIEWTIKRSCFGSPIIYVRKTYPVHPTGEWEWSRWRKANYSEQNAALLKILELNHE